LVNIISFPGLGIGEMKLNTVAFNILGKDVAWYGIIITLGIILAFLYTNWRATKNEGMKSDDVLDYAIFSVVAAIIGARAYYVITTLDVYDYDSFYDVIAIWNGGLAIYGGLIAGLITLLIVSKFKKLHPFKILDAVCPGVMIGQMIGRWGNFVNAEAFGSETTLPWRMGIQNIYHLDTIYVHPTFLYESLWNLIGFGIANILYRHKRFGGQIFLFYISWYGFGRMLIESLRTDSLYVGPFRISQLVGLASFVLGLTFTIILSFRSDKKYKAELAAAEAAEKESTLFEAEESKENKEEKSESAESSDKDEDADKPEDKESNNNTGDKENGKDN